MRINLLTPEIRRKVEARRILRMWGVVWAIGALLIGGLFVWQWNHFRDARQRVESLECKCKPLHDLQEKLQAQQEVLAKKISEREQLVRLQPTDNVLNVFAALVKSAQQQAGMVQVQRLNLLAATPVINAAGSKSGKTATTELSSTCSLQGIAVDDATLAQFMAGLRESNVFSAVELKSSTQQSGETGTARLYQIECHVEELP